MHMMSYELTKMKIALVWDENFNKISLYHISRSVEELEGIDTKMRLYVSTSAAIIKTNVLETSRMAIFNVPFH